MRFSAILEDTVNHALYLEKIYLPFKILIFYSLVGALLHSSFSAAVTAPSSSCYALDNSSYLFDFVSYYSHAYLMRIFKPLCLFYSKLNVQTEWIGHPFEYTGKDGDLVIRFCKDVETRSHLGYVDFGHYETYHDFTAGSGHFHFMQRFYNGDLALCEQTYDKMGRSAQVNFICGSCSTRICKDELGCICNVTFDDTKCRALIELAIPCANRGPRIFEGFTVGFHPRTSEIVYNGMTQVGFERLHSEYSFPTEQTSVSLYFTAKSSLSDLVGKPTVVVRPEKGLEAKLSGSATMGSVPTTLLPSVLRIDWRCDHAREIPYETVISIPVKGYDPIEFALTQSCDYAQGEEGDGDHDSTGWATFGVISCIVLVLATISCGGGVIYKILVERQRGLDALPGITILSSCLEAVSGPPGGYTMQGDGNSGFAKRPPFGPGSARGGQRASDGRYGSI